MLGLHHALTSLGTIHVPECRSLQLPDEYLSPGFWVLIAALAKKNRYRSTDIFFANENQRQYAEAICLHANLDGQDCYGYTRANDGKKYSPLVQLDSQEVTDGATGCINSCIRHASGTAAKSSGLKELCGIVGELHDNVWSHGRDTGFSMSQTNKVRLEDDHYIEFALADIGMGLLKEMRRVGMDVANDQEAIEWCIQKGNSTKLMQDSDAWAQRVPDDLMGGNPFGEGVQTFHNQNNHQGLGLHKLVELVTKYSGELLLGTGSCLLKIDFNGSRNYIYLENPWKGVSISCKFRTSSLFEAARAEQISPAIKALADKLKRGHK